MSIRLSSCAKFPIAFGAIALACWFPLIARSAEPANELADKVVPAAKSGGKYALLVGCTKYDNHDTWQLKGPANDVKLLHQVLVEHFGFTNDHIVTLAEGSDEAHRPTKAHIKREFDRLASTAHPDDQVVVLLSGHGSQQPEQDSTKPEDHKLDGLDEMFLPSDTDEWDDSQKSVTNVILDHELHSWIDRITKSGAHLWMVVDTCHSGTMMRGADAEQVRNVSPDSMGVPREAMIHARGSAKQRTTVAGTDGAAAERAPMRLGGSMKNRVGLYAAQSDEPAPEMPLPIDATDARPQGLLTYTLCELLTPKAKQERPSITYRELGQRIRQRYAAMNRTAPTPQVEGGDLDREVLGMKEWPGRSRIELEKRAGKWRVSAGTLLGLNKGSILAVYDPSSASNTPAGHVKVTEEGVASSVVTPCAYGETPKEDSLPLNGRCELAYVDFGSRPLTLAVEEFKPGAAGTDAAAIERVRQALEPLQHEKGSLIQLVTDAREAAWKVQLNGGKCYLVPRCGIVKKGGNELAGADAVNGKPAEQMRASEASQALEKTDDNPVFGPYGQDPKTIASELGDRLSRIARAQALINLAEQPAGQLDRGPDDVGVDVEMLRFKDDADKTGEAIHPGAGIELHDGDQIAFRITNTGRHFKVYPTLLFIDSGYGIQPIFPEEGAIVEALNPGESFTTGSLRVTAKTVGKEQVVAIAVKAAGQPVDFSGLAQPTLERERGDRPTSSLGLLLEQALYNEGQTRGIEPTKIKESAMAHIVWETRPKPKN